MIYNLAALTPDSATTATIGEVLNEIAGILENLGDEIALLADLSLDIILTSVDGTVVLTVDEVAELVATLLIVSY